MTIMINRSASKIFVVLLLVYVAASLIHFGHNAEFLADYPNLPTSWTRWDIYAAWAVMTTVGLSGWVLLSRGYQLAGLLVLVVYAAMGLDSLGHYVVAPLSSHTVAMNSTILFEVIAATLVLISVLWQIAERIISKKIAN